MIDLSRRLTALSKAGDRLFDRLRDPRAFGVTEPGGVGGDFSSLRGRKNALLVTFRRSGEAVPTPVWLAVDDRGLAYLKTRADAGKTARVRNDGRVLLAPATSRGRPLGPAVEGHARILEPERCGHAEQTLASAYGARRRLAEATIGAAGDVAYIEITPTVDGLAAERQTLG